MTLFILWLISFQSFELINGYDTLIMSIFLSINYQKTTWVAQLVLWYNAKSQITQQPMKLPPLALGICSAQLAMLMFFMESRRNKEAAESCLPEVSMNRDGSLRDF